MLQEALTRDITLSEVEGFVMELTMNPQPDAQSLSSPEHNCRGLRSGSLWRGTTQDYLTAGQSAAEMGLIDCQTRT